MTSSYILCIYPFRMEPALMYSTLVVTTLHMLQAEYKAIASQLSDYTLKLLGQVRSGAELDTILRESTQQGDKDRLARLKLAIRYGDKLVSLEGYLT